jgi:glyoxalase family protein
MERTTEHRMAKSAGIHHITAIAGEPKRNVAFYTRTLGLRLVKRTVNFDDPSSWHLYYGNEVGAPGTALTFFTWQGKVPQGTHGTGEAQEVAFAIPEGALDFWAKRLDQAGVAHGAPERRLGEVAIALHDPDGLKLELVADPDAGALPGWSNGEIPAAHAVRGFHGITLEVADLEPTARVLQEVFGFRPAGTEYNRHRFLSEGAKLGRVIDLRLTPGLRRHVQGLGTNHHVAFRAAKDADEMELRGRALALGLRATEQIDRNYFRSVYFREPGGILFEIATDDPGFTRDEPKEKLGGKLMLPPWFERDRPKIEVGLPALE